MNEINKRSKLAAVAPKAAAPSKPKTLIYGAPGVGKTWASLDFPTVYYIDTEGGANLGHYMAKLETSGGVYLGPEHGALNFDLVLEQIQALMSEKHDFKTLVIDSISKLFNTAIADEASRLTRENKKDEYGASKKPAVAYMRRLVALLTKLDMNVILVSHEKDEYTGEGATREVTGKTFDCWDRLEYELHLCLHIRKQGASRVARVRKTRLLEFPDASTFPWSYEEFASRYGRDILERTATPVVFATAEQVREIEDLLKLINLPEGTVDKWLSKANAASFAEMDTDAIAKCIAFVREKLPPVSA